MTANNFKRPTKALQDGIAQGGVNLRILGQPGITPLEGGVPIVVDGKIMGAIGVSGVTSNQDAESPWRARPPPENRPAEGQDAALSSRLAVIVRPHLLPAPVFGGGVAVIRDGGVRGRHLRARDPSVSERR